MEILNKRQRARAQWRFWLSYLVLLLLSGFAIYETTRLPNTSADLQKATIARMQQRDEWWKDLGEASLALTTIRDIEMEAPGGYPGLSATELAKVDQLENLFDKNLKKVAGYCYADSVTHRNVLQIINGLRTTFLQIKAARRENIADGNNMDALKAQYEAEVQKLEAQLESKDQQIMMLMTKQPAGGGGGGGGGGATNPGGGGNPQLGQVGSGGGGGGNCKQVEAERNSLSQRLTEARGKALDIEKTADEIQNATSSIRRDKAEKQIINQKVEQLRRQADAIRKL